MCGRYLFIPRHELELMLADIKARLAKNDIPYTAKAGEIFPTNLAPILLAESGNTIPFPALWGFTNNMQWENIKRAREGKAPLKPKAVFNTRAETAATSRFWKDSLLNRRCLVPTSGFYEWQTQTDGSKTELMFTLPGAEVTMIAGIWHNEPDDLVEKGMVHFSMITTEPSESVADVHNRMPVVLRPGECEQWLTGDYTALFDRSSVKLEKSAV